MRTEAPPAIAEILLLEQNTADVALIKESTESANVTVVAECPDILSFLRRQGEYETARRPDLIILDLDLARTEDCEMLTEIKRDPRFKRIPIVVLASSEGTENIFQAYDLHANAYILKPPDCNDFIRVMRATLHFWLTLARLPRE